MRVVDDGWLTLRIHHQSNANANDNAEVDALLAQAEFIKNNADAVLADAEAVLV